MLWLAKLGVFLFALWLIAVAIFMMIKPVKCLGLLRRMGSTPMIHYGEHILRGLAGVSLMGIADQTAYQKAFLIIGGFLLTTSIIIAIAPRRWHHRYAVYWADKIKPFAVRLMAPMPLIASVYLLWVLAATLPNSL